MASGCVTVPAGSVIVCATGYCSLQVVATRPALGAWPGMAICTSYCVPGCSSTSEPRHSLLRASYHMSRPCRHEESPTLRKMTGQPAEPGFDGGVQYRPMELNVVTARAPLVGTLETAVTGAGVGVTVGVGVT